MKVKYTISGTDCAISEGFLRGTEKAAIYVPGGGKGETLLNMQCRPHFLLRATALITVHAGVISMCVSRVAKLAADPTAKVSLPSVTVTMIDLVVNTFAFSAT